MTTIARSAPAPYDFGDNQLFDSLGDYAPPGPTLDEQYRRESDLREAKRTDLHYQYAVNRNRILTFAERADWAEARAIVCAAIAGEW